MNLVKQLQATHFTPDGNGCRVFKTEECDCGATIQASNAIVVFKSRTATAQETAAWLAAGGLRKSEALPEGYYNEQTGGTCCDLCAKGN